MEQPPQIPIGVALVVLILVAVVVEQIVPQTLAAMAALA
jgi:hypothetical protein